MTLRALATLILFAIAAAACGGSSKSTPTATPSPSHTSTPVPSALPTQVIAQFTPVEEVLTPPPDIDTSGWLTYRDAANGFELKYPPDATVKRNTFAPVAADGKGTEFSLPFAPGTTLELKFAFVSVTDASAAACVPWEMTNAKAGATAGVVMVRSRDAQFLRTWEPGGGMSHGFSSYAYKASRSPRCVTISTVLYEASQSVLHQPPPPLPDSKQESRAFLAMISTFRWLN